MELFFTTLLSVFLLGLQQQNVQHGKHIFAAMTSMMIAYTQFTVYRAAASGEWWEWMYMGVGGSIGIVSSMHIHKYLRERKSKDSCTKEATSV